MAIKIDESQEYLFEKNQNVCVVGKFPINATRLFVTKQKKIIKGYCTSWWQNGGHFKSSFLILNESYSQADV